MVFLIQNLKKDDKNNHFYILELSNLFTLINDLKIRNKKQFNYGEKMRSLISLLCVLLITAFSFGQDKTLTLDQAVNIALQKNTTLQRSMNNLDVAESGVKVAYGNFMPSLSANGGWNWNRSEDAGGLRNVGGSVFNFPPQTSESRNYNAGLNTSVTLFDGLANFASLSQSKDNLESSRLKLERVKQDIVFQTVSLYYAVITNDQLVKVNEENMKWNQRNLETIT